MDANNKQRQRDGWIKSMWKSFRRVKVYIVFTLVLLAIIAAAYIIRSCRGNTLSAYSDDKIDITPTQVMALEKIGEWEFLSIDDEEMVDTVRKGFFKDDELMRIYSGTLRLGIDMRQVKKGWIKSEGDSIDVILPKIKLLDDDFIDEAKTQSFFESGSWSDADRAALYRRAVAKMKARCLTKSNIESAEANALRQFDQIFKSMGFENVSVRFGE